MVYSNTVNTTKGDPNERKIKLLNKTLKSLRVDISNLQKENQNMRKVRNTNMYGNFMNVIDTQRLFVNYHLQCLTIRADFFFQLCSNF